MPDTPAEHSRGTAVDAPTVLPTRNDHARDCPSEPPSQNDNVLSSVRDKQNTRVPTVRDNITNTFYNDISDDEDYAQVADVFEDLGYCEKEG